MRLSLRGDDKPVLQSLSAQDTGVPGGSRDLRDVDWRSRPGGSPSTADRPARPSSVVTRRSLDYSTSGAYPAGRVVVWLVRHPRFSFHFKPTAASWTNQVKVWFGILSRQAIRRGSFESVRPSPPPSSASAAGGTLAPRPLPGSRRQTRYSPGPCARRRTILARDTRRISNTLMNAAIQSRDGPLRRKDSTSCPKDRLLLS
jgi:hypothetical protein